MVHIDSGPPTLYACTSYAAYRGIRGYPAQRGLAVRLAVWTPLPLRRCRLSPLSRRTVGSGRGVPFTSTLRQSHPPARRTVSQSHTTQVGRVKHVRYPACCCNQPLSSAMFALCAPQLPQRGVEHVSPSHIPPTLGVCYPRRFAEISERLKACRSSNLPDASAQGVRTISSEHRLRHRSLIQKLVCRRLHTRSREVVDREPIDN